MQNMIQGHRPQSATDFKRALGSFPSGVTVVTYETETGPRGITVSSFTSVSLDPPLVLVSLRRESTAAGYVPCRPFTVNVLKQGQSELAYHFGGGGKGDPESLPIVEGEVAPRIAEVAARFTCLPWADYDGGDHLLVLGEVHSFEVEESDSPMVYVNGRILD